MDLAWITMEESLIKNIDKLNDEQSFSIAVWAFAKENRGDINNFWKKICK